MYINIPIFSKEECTGLISEFGDGEFITGKTSFNKKSITETQVRQCDVKNLITENKLITSITDKIKNTVKGHIEISELIFIRYGKGGEYKVHIDRGEGLPRKFSFSIPLNDEYEGGELDLYASNKVSSKQRVPQNIGSAIFFNSTVPHAINPVTEGVRYVIVGWINDTE